MILCKHETKHTEMHPGRLASVNAYMVQGKIETHVIPEIKASISTYCADCGVLLKRVEILDKSIAGSSMVPKQERR